MLTEPVFSTYLECCRKVGCPVAHFRRMFLCAAVRYGRVPKRSLSADDQPVSSTEPIEMQHAGSAESTVTTLSPADANQSAGIETEEDIAAFESRQLAVFDVILSVAHSHTVHCDTTEDKVAALAKKPASLVMCIFVCVRQPLHEYRFSYVIAGIANEYSAIVHSGAMACFIPGGTGH